jgi:hypothetical protein
MLSKIKSNLPEGTENLRIKGIYLANDPKKATAKKRELF